MNPFLSILLAASAATAGTIYNVVDLGSLGGASAAAFGLSSTGQTVGTATTPFGDTRAFSSSGSGMSNLFEGEAAAVNGAGQIAGTQLIGGQPFATLWSNGSPQSIAGTGSYATAIDESGDVAGMLGSGHAFRAVDGSVQDLGVLPGGTWTSAYAINDAGQVAGYGDVGGGTFRAFVWSPGGGFQILGTFGGADSYAMAINSAGEIAGSAQLPSGYMEAFLSTGSGLVNIGTLGGGSSYAYGINDAGDIVGYSWVSGVAHAFVYSDGLMLDLNGLIDPSSGWVLTEAYAINGTGQIAGAGWFDGVEHAFRLDPVVVPEPGTWMFTLGGLAILKARFPVPPRLRRRVRLPRRRRSGAWLA